MPNRPFNILMADDDAEDLEMMEDAITNLEPSVIFNKVYSGKQAIRFLKDHASSNPPCLIILDYNMPETNGAEVLSVIAQDNRYAMIPKVMLSTSNRQSYIEECLNKGAVDFFVKPHNVDDLMEVAKKMLDYCRH